MIVYHLVLNKIHNKLNLTSSVQLICSSSTENQFITVTWGFILIKSKQFQQIKSENSSIVIVDWTNHDRSFRFDPKFNKHLNIIIHYLIFMPSIKELGFFQFKLLRCILCPNCHEKIQRHNRKIRRFRHVTPGILECFKLNSLVPRQGCLNCAYTLIYDDG